MEDLFQIIFILIFILSSIASSIKKNKKKKQAKKPVRKPVKVQPTTDPFAEPQPVAKKKQKSSAELLEEMLGLKIQLPEPQQREAPKVYSEDSHDTWDPAKEYETDSHPSEKLSKYEEKIIAKKTELKQDKQKHKAFKDTESKPIKPIVKKKTSKASLLLKKQDSLKDLIVVQEILNKPKALRR